MTDFDPFADTPVEATTVEAPGLEVTTKGTKAKITLKGGAGFDVPWIPLVYPSIEAAHADLTDPETQRQLAELFEVVAKANTSFAAKVAAHGGGTAPAPYRGSAPAGAASAPEGTPPPPGPDWTYKTGTGKNGKIWKAWMPPRGSNEQPVWL